MFSAVIKPLVVNMTILFSLIFNANLFFPFSSKNGAHLETKNDVRRCCIVYGFVMYDVSNSAVSENELRLSHDRHFSDDIIYRKNGWAVMYVHRCYRTVHHWRSVRLCRSDRFCICIRCRHIVSLVFFNVKRKMLYGL